MNIYDFITKQEIENISKSIEYERDFETIERKVKGYEFTIRSTRTVISFSEDVKEDDFMIGIGFNTGTRGNGKPLAGKELDKLKNVDELTKFLDEYMRKNRINGYEGIKEYKEVKEEKQLTLF